MNPEVEQEFLESLEVWAHEWETALQRVLEGQEGELNLVDGKSYRLRVRKDKMRRLVVELKSVAPECLHF